MSMCLLVYSSRYLIEPLLQLECHGKAYIPRDTYASVIVLYYDAKVPISDNYSTKLKCNHTIEDNRV